MPVYVQRPPTLFHRLMGAMKTTASRETLASEHSDSAAAAITMPGGNGAINASPVGSPYQRRREHSPSPGRSQFFI